MKRGPWRFLVSIMAALTLDTAAQSTLAEERLVFVSAFAAGKDGAIHAYQLDLDTGKLTPAQRTTGAEHPFYLAIAPNQKLLYSIHAKQFGSKDHEEVAAYEIAGRNGELKLLNRQSALGSGACYLDVDATGKAVLVANYSTGNVASLPVNKDGSLGKAASFFQHKGDDKGKPKQTHAHCIVVSPDNRFVFAADLGLDQVLAYQLDPTKAKLTANRPAFVNAPAGAGPRHLTFHPDGKHMYVINEMGNSVTQYDYDADTGALTAKDTISTLPKGFTGKSYCADLKITPNGRFLYGTNRGHDSIASYRIEGNGRLKLIGIEPSKGKGPQNLAITPDGKLMLCANMPENNVVVFRIDQKTGSLTSVGTPISMPSPSCIRILPK